MHTSHTRRIFDSVTHESTKKWTEKRSFHHVINSKNLFFFFFSYFKIEINAENKENYLKSKKPNLPSIVKILSSSSSWGMEKQLKASKALSNLCFFLTHFDKLWSRRKGEIYTEQNPFFFFLFLLICCEDSREREKRLTV